MEPIQVGVVDWSTAVALYLMLAHDAGNKVQKYKVGLLLYILKHVLVR